jgi:myo-inositol-1(or 4)-monophosphatase
MTKKDKAALISAAHRGGRILVKYFGKTLSPTEKSTLWDFQTEADVGSEKEILKILRKAFPKYNIHAEEAGKTDNGSEFTIAIDPLDGTNNFVLGIPNFSVSIGVLHKGQGIAGVVYQPILRQTYYAEKGKGAYLNGKKIKVSKITDMSRATVAYTCGYRNSRKRIAIMLTDLMRRDHKRIAFNWSPAYDYCLLAAGKIESMITDSGTEIYDFSAGKLIALEAGAVLTDLYGKKEKDYRNDSFILSNNKTIHRHILKIINSAEKQRQ